MILCFHRHSGFVPARKERSAISPQLSAPGQSTSQHLGSLTFDIILCFHRHSGFVPRFLYTEKGLITSPLHTGGGGESSEPGEGFLPVAPGSRGGPLRLSGCGPRSRVAIGSPVCHSSTPLLLNPSTLRRLDSSISWLHRRKEPKAGKTDENRRELSGISYWQAVTSAQPNETTLAYVVPFVKRKMRRNKKAAVCGNSGVCHT